MRELSVAMEAARSRALHFALADDRPQAINVLAEAGAFFYNEPLALAQLAVDASRIDLYFGAERSNGHSLGYVATIASRLDELGTMFDTLECNGQRLQIDRLCLRGMAGIMQGVLHEQTGTEFLEIARKLCHIAEAHANGEQPLSLTVLKNQVDRIDWARLNSMHSGYFRRVTRQLLEDELERLHVVKG